MSIKRTIITTIVGLTLVALVAPVSANALTIADLQAQIQALMAQLNQLQGTTGTTTGNVPAVCAGVTFTRNLTTGSTGSDVKCLQAVLNLSASTQVATTGAGSPGAETTYFGSRTLAAVRAYQSAQGFIPANQVGPMTRAKLNAYLGGGTGGTLPPVIVPTGAGLTVQLASNNPASGTVILAQGLAPLAKFTFTNGDNAEVKITNFKVNRIGVSLDTSFSNIYLFNGAVRLTDAATVSSGVVTFNDSAGLFTVPAGGAVTITVAADLNATAGQTLGVSINAATSITTNASSVKGTFPISGNLMTAATATGAGVEFTATTTPTTNTSLTPQNDYIVWQNSAVITTRAVDFTRVAFKMVGSAKTADLQNFRLYVDGVQAGSTIANLDANNYVTFDLTGSPRRLEAGSRVIKLMADIIGGSSLNFKFRISVSADANFVDSQYNVNTAPTTATTTGSFTVADVTSGVQTIASGTLTFTKKTDSPSGNVVNTASNQTLGKFTLTAAGERVKVESLYVRIIFTNVTGTDDCTAASTVCTTAASMLLRNGMLLANGVQIGSTTSISPVAAGTLFSPGSSLIVEPGSPVTLEVRGDIYDATGTYNDIDATDTLQVRIVAGSSNAQGLVSLSSLSTPSASTDGNTLTVKTGSLSLSVDPAYTAQTVVAPITAYKLAAFNLAANTTEAVNISTIQVDLDDVSSYASNLYLKYGTQITSVQPSITSYTKSWSINYNLPAGTTIPVEVYADVSSLMTAGDGVASVLVSGTTASSATAVNTNTNTVLAGQTINFSTGTFAAAFASTPQNQAVRGGQEVEIGRWKFTSDYQEYTIQEIKIDPDLGANSSTNAEDAIVSLTLKDGSTVLGTQSFNNVDTNGSTGGYYFTGLSVKVPAGTSKTLTAVATMTVTSATAGNTGLRVQPSLSYVKEMNPQGTITTSIDDATNANQKDANSTYVYRTIPTLSKVELTNGTIANGQTLDLYKFTVAAPSYTVNGTTYGDIHIKQFKVDVSWSDAGTVDQLELESIKLFKDGVDITDIVTIQEEDQGYSVESTTGVISSASKIIVVWDGTTEDNIAAGSSTTYTIQGVPQGFKMAATDTANDSVALSFSPDTAAYTLGSTSVDYIGFLNTDSTQQIGSALGLFTSATADTSAQVTDVDLLWSDDSAISHSASTTAGTGDWTNSYLVKDSLSSEVWSR
jgi:hypothetical protein